MSALKPAYVPIMELRDARAKSMTRYYFATAAGETTMDSGRAIATRDRRQAEAVIAGHPGGRVLEWVLSDGRITF